MTDESGLVLPGVTVTATSQALQVLAIAVITSEHGEYRLTPLPIGIYFVEYSLSGFQTVRREGVRLTVGFVAKVVRCERRALRASTVSMSALVDREG